VVAATQTDRSRRGLPSPQAGAPRSRRPGNQTMPPALPAIRRWRRSVNGDRFDDLTRLLASHTTRRQILRTAVWGVVALLAGALRSGGLPAAARSSALTSPMCSQQDQVSAVVPYCPAGANDNAGTYPSPPGATPWNAGVCPLGGAATGSSWPGTTTLVRTRRAVSRRSPQPGPATSSPGLMGHMCRALRRPAPTPPWLR
jgi:hypothetical protein